MPTSQGRSAAFSTGSQPQNPPHPEHLVRPPGPEQDAHGQEGPREQGPPAGLALPVLVELAGDQRCDGEGEGEREAHQSQIEHGRVDEDQRIVLEQRVGAGPVGRDGPGDVPERIGGPEHEPEEERGHHVDHQGGPADEVLARAAPEAPDHGGGVPAEDHPPQQDRPGQCRPQAGDRVEHRGVPAVVLGHVAQREVVGDKGVLHGRHGDHSPEQDERGVHLAAADDRGPPLGQSRGHDDDSDHGGREPEEDSGVAERSVHRWEPVTRWPPAGPPVIACSRSEP